MSQALHEDQTRYGEEGPWHRAWHLNALPTLHRKLAEAVLGRM